MNICSNDGPASPIIQPQPIDRTEWRNQRARERYAQMSNDTKNERLENRRATYQQKKQLAGKDRDVYIFR
jgi:uncharacterized protein with von Willebrand factor type A (vWA) domain